MDLRHPKALTSYVFRPYAAEALTSLSRQAGRIDENITMIYSTYSQTLLAGLRITCVVSFR
jgi:hypothetical protein